MGGARGFTLLEAVLALVILTGATMAALGIRTQSMLATENMVRVQQAERDAQALFDMAIAGMLGRGESAGELPGETVWRGELGIETVRGYTVRRRPEVRENPAREAFGEAVPREVALWRYEIEVGGREVVFLWHR
jgi:type II secretory pathway pseudopilin PulG